MAFNSWAMGYNKMKPQMRNTIKVLDPDKRKFKISDVQVGAMFRYPKSENDQNVYMRVDTGIVLLASGAVYSNFNSDGEIEPITMVQISK